MQQPVRQKPAHAASPSRPHGTLSTGQRSPPSEPPMPPPPLMPPLPPVPGKQSAGIVGLPRQISQRSQVFKQLPAGVHALQGGLGHVRVTFAKVQLPSSRIRSQGRRSQSPPSGPMPASSGNVQQPKQSQPFGVSGLRTSHRSQSCDCGQSLSGQSLSAKQVGHCMGTDPWASRGSQLRFQWQSAHSPSRFRNRSSSRPRIDCPFRHRLPVLRARASFGVVAGSEAFGIIVVDEAIVVVVHAVATLSSSVWRPSQRMTWHSPLLPPVPTPAPVPPVPPVPFMPRLHRSLQCRPFRGHTASPAEGVTARATVAPTQRQQRGQCQ